MFSKILVISSLLCQAKYLLLCDKNFYPDSKGPIKNYASLEDPFRMQKCNLLWNKARVKLAETKLEHLYSALKVQDKNELTLKKLKSEGNDKDGIKEDEMRKKFNNIMLSYGLGGTPEPKVLMTELSLNIIKSKALEKKDCHRINNRTLSQVAVGPRQSSRIRSCRDCGRRQSRRD